MRLLARERFDWLILQDPSLVLVISPFSQNVGGDFLYIFF